MRYEAALRQFGEQCEEFAAELNEEKSTPEDFKDCEERGDFYWSEQDAAWQHGGHGDREFLGSVCWEDGRWTADWQEHK